MADVLSTWETSRCLGVYASTVRRLIYRGRFPGAFKVGRVWRIPKADAPIVRSLSLLVLVLVPVLLVFSYLYLSLAARGDRQMEGVETHLDALYFTVTMITTVGFGDITPSGQLARGVATVQMVFNVVVLGFLVRTVLQVGQESSRWRHRVGSPSTGGGGLGERAEQWQASPNTDARAERDEP